MHPNLDESVQCRMHMYINIKAHRVTVNNPNHWWTGTCKIKDRMVNNVNNKPARSARKPRMTYLYINTALQRTPYKLTNQITRYITTRDLLTVQRLSRTLSCIFRGLVNVDKFLI